MTHAYHENNNVPIGGAEEFGAAEAMGSPAGEFEEVKQGEPDVVFRNPLPYVEKPVSTFKDYKDRNFNDKRNVHNQAANLKIPYHFKVLTCPHIGIELDYCEVTKSLLDLLIIIYNKLYDNQALN